MEAPKKTIVRTNFGQIPALFFFGTLVLPRKAPNKQGFFYLPNPLKPWENKREHQINQENGDPKDQGKEGHGFGVRGILEF